MPRHIKQAALACQQEEADAKVRNTVETIIAALGDIGDDRLDRAPDLGVGFFLLTSQRRLFDVPRHASSYSMTSSAVASSSCGTVRPRALAVLRLITSSNLVACTTGKSAGLFPLRIRPT